MLGGDGRRPVPHGHARGDVPERNQVLAQLLQRPIRVGGLHVGIRIDQRRFLTEDDLLQHGQHRLPLGEPLPPAAPELALRFVLPEDEEPGHPPVGERKVVEVVQQPGAREVREPEHGQGAEVEVSQRGFDAAGKRRIGQDCIQVRRNPRYRDAPVRRGNRAMQVGEGVLVRHRRQARHHVPQEHEGTVGPCLKVLEVRPPGDRPAGIGGGALHQGFRRPRPGIGGRQVGERQPEQRLEMTAPPGKFPAPFIVDQLREAIGKRAARVTPGWNAFGVEVQGPAGPEPPQHVVDACGHGHQFGFGGALEIGTAEPG